MIAQALANGHYELAGELANAVCKACRRPQGKEFRKKAIEQRDRVAAYSRAEADRVQAEAKLRAIRMMLTRILHWREYYVDDWKAALPHLANGK